MSCRLSVTHFVFFLFLFFFGKIAELHDDLKKLQEETEQKLRAANMKILELESHSADNSIVRDLNDKVQCLYLDAVFNSYFFASYVRISFIDLIFTRDSRRNEISFTNPTDTPTS